MNHRDWVIVAFILAAIMSVTAMWVADMQAKQQSAENSMSGVKTALTPFERDSSEAMKKLDGIYGDGK